MGIAENEKYPYLIPLKKMNPIIRFFTVSDMFICGGLGLITPIFAIYITQTIPGGTLEVVGIAASIFLITKSLLQIIMGSIIDKIKGEKDDFILLISGVVLYTAVPLLYLLVKTPFELYMVQCIYGVAAALAFPTWMAIFTKNIDKEREGIEWSGYATLVEIIMAISATVGGYISYHYGFKYIFIFASIAIFLGNLLILYIYRTFYLQQKIIQKL